MSGRAEAIGRGLVALLPTWRQLVAWIIATILIVAVGALLVAWSGLYNVAASQGHLAITRWFLAFGMTNSVATHSALIEVPDNLDDPDLIRLGAGHYRGGCAVCHGSPGSDANPIVEQMLPRPPALVGHVGRWKDRELFWLVKHGLKYAGMPGWTTQQRDDEVWAMVAFVRTLPTMSAQEYTRLTLGNVESEPTAPVEIMHRGAGGTLLAACARCHGDTRSGPTSSLVPSLAGQTETYLVRALEGYRAGQRQSGFMEPVASELSQRDIAALARAYAGLERAPAAARSTADPQLVAAGEALATRGAREAAIPACLTCHGSGGKADYPVISDQSAAYLAGQLRLWKRGLRMASPHGRTMGAIAQRLNEDQIIAAATYFSTRDAALDRKKPSTEVPGQ